MPVKYNTFSYVFPTYALHIYITQFVCLVISGEKAYKFEEFLPIYSAVSKEKDTGTFADFNEAFKTFDREGQGFISAAEMRHVLTCLGMLFTQVYLFFKYISFISFFCL